MKLTAAELWSLFLQQKKHHGWQSALRRTFDPKVQRLFTRKWIRGYVRSHDLGAELGRGLESIGPTDVKLVHVFAPQLPAHAVATESFPADQFPYEEMSFDYIVAAELPPGLNAQATLKEWYRVMNEGGHVFVFGSRQESRPSQKEWVEALGQSPGPNSWEVLEVLDTVSDQPDHFGIVARRKRERSGIIEILKQQQTE